MSFRVLLLARDSQAGALYAELVKEIFPAEVDQITGLGNSSELTAELMSRLSYHLIIIDCSGDLNGIAWLEGVKGFSPATSVILVSEQGDIEEAVEAIRNGAEDYLKKPVNVGKLQLAIKRALDRKRVLEEDSGASSYLNLLHSCQLISAAMEQGKVFSVLHGFFHRELRSQHSAIYRLEAGELVRFEDSAQGERVQKDRAMTEVLDIALKAAGIADRLARSGDVSCFIDRGTLTPGLFVFRFRCVGQIDYFYACLSPEQPTPLEAFESRLRLLRVQIEVSGRNIEKYMGVQTLAYVDDATGLYNTRYLGEILDREIQQYENSGRPFAVLFMDVDRFKSVNDTYGHLIGTKLLNVLGAQLKKYVRDTDTVFRYGGDEFVAVLSGCDLPTAQRVAERIRQSVENESFLRSEGVDVRFTVSIGVALYPEHAQSKRAIIEAADHAMYNAKKTSRNCVYIAATGSSMPQATVQPASGTVPAGSPAAGAPAAVRRLRRRNGK